VADFGYRAIHKMTLHAKAAVNAFYGSRPDHSFFGSCSNGGRQALVEALSFPEDYDGILAGAPANNWTRLLTSALWDAQALTYDASSYIPSSKLPAIARAVNVACDALDGVSDGLLNDPRQCHFDPAVLLCRAGDSENCLTAPQVAALKKLYQGPRDSQGHEIFPGLLPGSEEGRGGWEPWVLGAAPGTSLVFTFSTGFFSDMVYEKAGWSYKDAVLDQAVKDADTKMAGILNATDTNLAAFKARGGKLILYHGWSDPAISPLNTINYYSALLGRMGKRNAEEFVRLYMAPGMQHCNDGPGPNSFGQEGGGPQDPQHSIYIALERWVEKNAAPSSIIATKNRNDEHAQGALMTRPLCPYPQAANYKGTGDTNDAANFACATPN